MEISKVKDIDFSLGKYKMYYLILSLTVLIVFGNTLFNGYNMDDNLVTQNHSLTAKGFSAISEIFSSSYYSDNAEINFGYRPMVHLSFALEHQFFGQSATVSHFFNLLFYLLAVLLFFKLLINWFGSQYQLLVMIAALLFAVHPIHTEVVASIKNRDEILAFLFAVVAGLFLHNYYTKHKIINLLSLSIFFMLAILSKKSIYPIVFVFPLMSIGLNKQKLSIILLGTIALALPASIIVSEYNLIKFVLLFVSPFIFVFVLYFSGIMIQFFYHKLFKNIFFSIYFSAFTSWFFIILGILHLEFAYFLVSIPFAFLVIKKNEVFGLSQLVLQVFLIGVLFYKSDLERYAILLGLGYTAYLYHQQRKEFKYFIFISIAMVASYLYIHFSLANLLLIFNLVFVFFFFFKKPIFSLLTIAMVFIFTFYFFNFTSYHWSILFVGLVCLINWKFKQMPSLKFLPFVFLIVISLYTYFQPNCQTLLTKAALEWYLKPTDITDFSGNKILNNKGFSEGRGLQYFENTLIANHSKSEAVATGFSTLGEYFKLMVFPFELSFFYGYAKLTTTNFYDYFIYISMLLYVGLTVLALWLFHKKPIISIGIFWYLVSVLLFSNWVELVAGMVGERLAFTASAGFCIFIAGFIIWLKPNFSFKKPQLVEFSFLLVLVVFGVRSIARNNDWKSPIELMSNDISHLNNSVQAHNLLALNLMYEVSNNAKLTPQQALAMQNDAVLHFKNAIQLFPSFFNANYDLSRIYVGQGDFENAKKYLLNAYVLDRENLFVLEELTKTCFELKQVNQMEYFGNKYLKYVPNNENLHELMAYLCLVSNKKQHAKLYAERGLKVFPNNNNLRMVLRDSQVK